MNNNGLMVTQTVNVNMHTSYLTLKGEVILRTRRSLKAQKAVPKFASLEAIWLTFDRTRMSLWWVRPLFP